MTAVPAPPSAQRPATHMPPVGVMWLNAALFWGIFPGLYLVYLTVRNISWAVSNRQPWLRYALPLGTVAVLLLVLLIWAATLPDPSTTDPYGFTG